MQERGAGVWEWLDKKIDKNQTKPIEKINADKAKLNTKLHRNEVKRVEDKAKFDCGPIHLWVELVFVTVCCWI